MRQLIKSSVMLITSIMLFTAVVYAWFAMSNTNEVQPLSATLTDGSPIAYEIKYYTKHHIYKYDMNANSVLVYDELAGTYVAQEALSIDLPSYAFNGVFMSEYDPIIAENNLEKNVIVEITMAFDGSPITLRNSIYSDPLIGSEAVANYPYSTSRPYYVTEVSLVQTLISKDYNNFLENENKYDTLTNVFNSVDLNMNLIHPMYSFYDNQNYQARVDFGNVELTTDVTSYKIYYNFTYDEAMINQFLATENISVDIDLMSYIVFFQDVKFSIVIGGNS